MSTYSTNPKPTLTVYSRDTQIHFPAEFISNPNQTHLSMLSNVFRIIRKSQVGEFDQGWSYTLQESGSREPDLSITDYSES